METGLEKGCPHGACPKGHWELKRLIKAGRVNASSQEGDGNHQVTVQDFSWGGLGPCNEWVSGAAEMQTGCI